MARKGVVDQIMERLPVAVESRAGRQLAKSSRDRTGIRAQLSPVIASDYRTPELVVQQAAGDPSLTSKLAKSLGRFLDGPADSVERLAFERDPQRIAEFAGIWRPKLQLIPDNLLKRMAIQDDLVAAIVHTRCNHVAQFGRRQEDRHQKGFKFVVDKQAEEELDDDARKRLQARVARVEKMLLTCGLTEGYSKRDQCSFTEFLYMTARNAVVVGRAATEVVYVSSASNPTERKFHSFRPVDAGTVYYAAPYKDAQDAVREQARRLLEQMKNERLRPEKFENDEYSWVQVIDGRPLQAFSSEELLVQNFYPVTDVELQGYPVTPLDCAISAVTTHINITNHNKLYFQYGRAARGMLVIQSQDIDPETIQAVKQQFNASINSVSNSWRMPVFGLDPDDKIEWVPIDQGSRDMEFQYLSDSNARTIMAAFQMSPEELPGYQHLSRGTNNQALSESQNEWKLTAARDVGIRPLLAKIEDYINDSLIPIVDPELAKYAKLRLVGLDIEDEEKESVRLQQDMAVHMTYDEVLSKVEKKPLGAGKCGDFPLNQNFLALMKQYMTFGEILEKFRGVEGAGDPKKHPEWAFYENEGWFKFQEMQAQAAAQQQAQQQPPPGGAGPGDGQPAAGDLQAGVDQLQQLLGKSESESGLGQSRQTLRAMQRAANLQILESWRADLHKLAVDVAEVADLHKPAPKKQ